jgi:hypothetical protein
MQSTFPSGTNENTVNEIAAEAEADPRSVWKRLAGGKVRGRVAARIDRAIAARVARDTTSTAGGTSDGGRREEGRP